MQPFYQEGYYVISCSKMHSVWCRSRSDNKQDAAVCKFCGTPFIVEKAIKNYNTYVTQNFGGANVTIVGANENSLLTRAHNFLSHRQFDKAFEYAQKVLDVNPKSGEAYLVSALSEFEVTDIEEMVSLNKNISPESNHNYNDAIKYLDKEKSDKLSEAIKVINERIKLAATNENLSSLKQSISGNYFKLLLPGILFGVLTVVVLTSCPSSGGTEAFMGWMVSMLIMGGITAGLISASSNNKRRTAEIAESIERNEDKIKEIVSNFKAS